MIWIFAVAVGLAMTFATLGALSVWAKVLVIGLQVAVLALIILTMAFIWKHIFRKS